MTAYRILPLSDKGRVIGAATVITCESDEEALERADALMNGHDVDLWAGARHVARLDTKAGR